MLEQIREYLRIYQYNLEFYIQYRAIILFCALMLLEPEYRFFSQPNLLDRKRNARGFLVGLKT